MDPVIAQVNAVFQIIIAIILLGSLVFKKKRRYFLHGATMLVAVVLNVSSFLLVMLPSLLSLAIIETQPLNVISVVALVHACVGALCVILGAGVVASWHLQSSTQGCVKRRRMMRLVLVLWLSAFVVGVVLYAFLNTSFSI
jgi:uncharacterized membrane protein YozB (DUF420 family)